MNLQELRSNSIKNILIILLKSALLGVFFYLLLNSALVSIFIFLLSFFILGRKKGGIKVRRVGVDKLLMTEGVISSDVCSIDLKFGIGFIDEINQPLYIGASKEGLYLHYICYRKQPPLLLVWDNMNKIEVFSVDDKVSAKVYLSVSLISLIVPWDENYEKSIPQGFNLIK
ncbi:hypothetical protein [Pseudoalteromonas piscicida]|uniref:Uncharacterized protein n=1 Tax=Pseudoalteromonas piscicida TaxID=43662 RepID=A0A2A5JUQ5_PSEO7|nr:hypothetical protein [Pseudoalteromonas piscicida]PCK33148.1 hypothetical protein CEX98_03250 [Pseudoalteromonas piscicida]